MKIGINSLVIIYKKTEKGIKLKGNYTIKAISSKMISFQKDAGYFESISVVDLRQGNYVLKTDTGLRLVFPPMPNWKEIEKSCRASNLKEYRETKGAACYKSLRKISG